MKERSLDRLHWNTNLSIWISQWNQTPWLSPTFSLQGKQSNTTPLLFVGFWSFDSINICLSLLSARSLTVCILCLVATFNLALGGFYTVKSFALQRPSHSHIIEIYRNTPSHINCTVLAHAEDLFGDKICNFSAFLWNLSEKFLLEVKIWDLYTNYIDPCTQIATLFFLTFFFLKFILTF